MKKTIGISANDFVQYGCPCCCQFKVSFYQIVLGTRIAICNNTNDTFHIIVGKRKKSPVVDGGGKTVEVIKHPLGQIV